jgi:hypothetical protein
VIATGRVGYRVELVYWKDEDVSRLDQSAEELNTLARTAGGS